MTINATSIGKKLDGIGRFSLLIAKHFIGKREIIINEKAKIHFSEDELKELKIIPASYSPDFGFRGHLKRLIYINFIKTPLFNLSQLQVNFFNPNQIVVVHDIIPLLFPEFHKKQYHYFKYILPYALKKVKKIIVVSNHTKELLIKHYNLEEEKIKVIYNGIVLPEFKEVEKENFILYVGRDSPTKNLKLLVDAFNELDLKDYKLYLVGVNREFNNKNIKSLGYVEDEELDMLYRKAKIFVLPSLYEGFGYPVIEAMARKTAVIASNVSSLPEIGGDGALYFNPYDKEELKEKIKFLIENEDKRKKLENIGFKRSQDFSIERMLKQYEKLLKD